MHARREMHARQEKRDKELGKLSAISLATDTKLLELMFLKRIARKQALSKCVLCVQECIRGYMWECVHIQAHTHTRTRKQVLSKCVLCVRGCIRGYMCECAHIQAHTHAHTCTRTHKQVLSKCVLCAQKSAKVL